jgi:hypothetical protein
LLKTITNKHNFSFELSTHPPAISLNPKLRIKKLPWWTAGILILTDDDENLKEIAERFTRATGRPVWRNLTEIPR